MIKKLERKFIIINMALISIVLLVTFAAVYISTQQRLTQMEMSVLQHAIQRSDPSQPKGNSEGGPFRERDFVPIPTFTVTLGDDKKIVDSYGALFDLSDKKEVQKIVDSCLAQGRDSGVISDANLRFLKRTDLFGTRLAFMDRTVERKTLSMLIVTSILVGLGSLLAFFLISLFLAKWALKPVKKAWEQQKQFVADASHELKTPITVILANAGIVLSHPEATVRTQSKWIDHIQTEANRMSTLVENLLFLAKTDDTRPQTNFSGINLSDTVYGSILPFESVIFEEGKKLESHIEPEIFINGDESKLKQLVGILLDNACKYSDDNGTITVKLWQDSDRKVKLSVTNTGATIPEDQVDLIFERFFRVDKSRVRETGGYGLGLSIAKGIAAMHKARITVVSTPETGTNFTVTFSSKQ